jgi:hypothetical protein
MTDNKRRLRFVIILTVAATLYGSLLAYRLLPAQSDLFSDVLKLASMAFFSTAIAAYIWWTIIMRKTEKAWGGLLAGSLTAICVIPVPTFLGGFKGSFNTHQNLLSAIEAGFKYSLSTFSTAEFIALPLCAAAGYILAK